MKLLIAVGIALGVLSLAVANASDGLTLVGPAKPAFIYVGAKDDAGLQQSLDLAREEMEARMKTTIPFIENVGNSSAEVAKAVEKFIGEGYNIILGGSPSYTAALSSLAAKYPQTAFFNFQNDIKDSFKAANVEFVYARTYESQYLCGVIAGEQSKAGNIGFLSQQRRNVENWEINAYALGARTMKPDANVHVLFTDTSDPTKVREAASKLIDNGADVLGQSLNGATAQSIAQERGVFATGRAVSLLPVTPKATLCSAIWSWNRYIIPQIGKIAAGGWTASPNGALIGMIGGATDVVCCNEAVSQESMAKFIAARDDIIIMQKEVFSGPLKDREGKERVPPASNLPDDDLWAMNWYVQGVKVGE